MAVFTGHFFVTVWILSGLVLRSNARVLTKPCSGGEFIAAVNSSHLFGLPVECHDVCEVLAASRDSVAACSRGMHERSGWTLCESSTPEALLLQDSEKHLCLLLTTQQHNKSTPERSCTGINVNSDGCHDLKDNNLRHRRNAVIDETGGSADSQRGHSIAIIVSSAITVILLVLVSFLCVGGNKNAEPSASTKAPVNAVQEDSTQNATAVNQPSNHLDSANQTTVVNQNQGGNADGSGKAETADLSQHLYQNVNVQIEAGSESDHSEGLQLANQNQDHQPTNQNQGQLVVQLIANQNEELGDQNEEPQEANQNEAQANVQDHQAQQPADQDQAAQEAANGDQQQDPEKAKIPYGVVTIHSDQSNTPVDNNYAEVRNEDESIQDITYDRVNDDTEVIENGYSTVVRDKPAQQQPRRDRMYESVDEAFDRETKPSEPAVNGGEDRLEQDDTYEQVPDTFRQKVTSFSHQTEAPKLPPMNTRTRKPSDDPAVVQHRASSSATLPSAVAPSSPLMRVRLFSTPAIKSPPGKTLPPPSFPAPAAPPPTYPAPNPPSEYDDDDNALYARPEPSGGRTVSYPQLKDRANLEDGRKKASTLPVKATLSFGGPRSPASLGPLPELPKTSSEQPEQEEQEDVEPGYDTTEAIMARQDNDHLESGKAQEEEQVQQDHHEQQPSSPQRTSSMVKRDGKGYALPSTKRTSTSEESYAVVNLTQKRLSQRKKKEKGGAGKDADAVKSQSPPPESSPPPSSPPPLDPELVDEDLKQEPSVPPRLPQSEELVEPDKNEPPYAKVNKKKVSESDQTSATAEVPSTMDEAGDDDIDPYAAVDIIEMGNSAPITQVTPSDREYDTIDNVISPPGNHNPVNITLSELEGDYACVRSDATIPVSQRRDPGRTDAVTTTVQTPVDTAAHGVTLNNQNTTARLSSPEELTEL